MGPPRKRSPRDPERVRRLARKRPRNPDHGARVAYLRRSAAPGWIQRQWPGNLSEALLDYAEPLLAALPDDASLDDRRAALMCAATVWNLVLLEEAAPDGDDDLDRTRRELVEQLDDGEGTGARIVAAMTQRRRVLFGDDRRIIFRVDAFEEGGEVRVLVAGAPPRP
jgi:hypothetical protein